MKIITIIISIILSPALLTPQSLSETNKPFINYEFLAGINSSKLSDAEQSYLFEMKKDFTEDIFGVFSLGFHRTIADRNVFVKTYHKLYNDNQYKYTSVSYTVKSNNYDYLPVTFGIQYFIKNNDFKPYFICALNYNFINAKSDLSPVSQFGIFDKTEDIPQEFRTKHYENLPNHSWGSSIGIGLLYGLNSYLDIDIRYFYKFDNKSITSHQMLIGIGF